MSSDDLCLPEPEPKHKPSGGKPTRTRPPDFWMGPSPRPAPQELHKPHRTFQIPKLAPTNLPQTQKHPPIGVPTSLQFPRPMLYFPYS